jgi:hypothetical protein
MNSLKFKLSKWLGQGMVLAALSGVFLLYLQPAFQQVLANQLWGCL